MTLTRRNFMTSLGVAATLVSAIPANAATRKPNIIFFLADDMGIDLFGCYGGESRFKTPNIDAMAKAGTRFEACHAAPLCGPSRCMLMTGRYPSRTGGITNQSWREGGPGAQSKDEYPIARLLRETGYATCCSGKWRQVGETPGDWGFDEWLTDPTAGGWYWQKSYTKNGKLMEFPEEVYVPDHAHDFAMNFMQRNRKKPFFIYHSTHLVHLPILKTPDSKPDSQDLFADNIVYMDKMLGNVVAQVKKLGLANDTVILFSGDNGTAQRSYTVKGKQVNGAKASMLEGGTRVPLIAYGKGVAKGKIVGDLIDFTDMYPTFAELGGAKLPTAIKIDGHSYAPQIAGKKGTPREWIHIQLGKNWYVKNNGWKMNQNGELYDMKNAPFEEKPVPEGSGGGDADAARARLKAVLAELNPGGGKIDNPPPVNNDGKKKKNKKKA